MYGWAINIIDASYVLKNFAKNIFIGSGLIYPYLDSIQLIWLISTNLDSNILFVNHIYQSINVY